MCYVLVKILQWHIICCGFVSEVKNPPFVMKFVMRFNYQHYYCVLDAERIEAVPIQDFDDFLLAV